MELEKPQPEQVVVDTVIGEKWEPPIAPIQEAMSAKEKEKVKENEKESQAQEASAAAQPDNEPSSKLASVTVAGILWTPYGLASGRWKLGGLAVMSSNRR